MDPFSPRPVAVGAGALALLGLVPLAWGRTWPAVVSLVLLTSATLVVVCVQHTRTRAALAAAESARRDDVGRLLTDLARLEARRE